MQARFGFARRNGDVIDVSGLPDLIQRIRRIVVKAIGLQDLKVDRADLVLVLRPERFPVIVGDVGRGTCHDRREATAIIDHGLIFFGCLAAMSRSDSYCDCRRSQSTT